MSDRITIISDQTNCIQQSLTILKGFELNNSYATYKFILSVKQVQNLQTCKFLKLILTCKVHMVFAVVSFCLSGKKYNVIKSKKSPIVIS